MAGEILGIAPLTLRSSSCFVYWHAGEGDVIYLRGRLGHETQWTSDRVEAMRFHSEAEAREFCKIFWEDLPEEISFECGP